MVIKKAIVFIGSVMVLAACDRASSPTGPLSLHDGAASVRRDTTRSTTRTMSLTEGEGCAWVREGDADSVLVCSTQ